LLNLKSYNYNRTNRFGIVKFLWFWNTKEEKAFTVK